MIDREVKTVFLDRTMTNMLKAIAILLVVAAHVLKKYWIDEYAANILRTGGVSLFLILSGYGLYMSYKTKGISANYWKSKFEKVYCPYLIITLVYTSLFISNITVNILWKNLLLVDYWRNIDGTMWYLSFLLIWYVVFFVLFSIPMHSLFRIFLLFGVAFWFKAYAMNYFAGCAWQFMINSVAFPFGVLIAYLIDFIGKFSMKGSMDRYVSFLSVPAFGCYSWGILSGRISFGGLGLLLFVVLYGIVHLLRKNQHVVKLLVPIGVNSYILYLIEGKLIMQLSNIERINGDSTLFITLFVILCIIICIIWNKGRTVFIDNKKFCTESKK